MTVSDHQARAVVGAIDELATDVGRLQRRCEPETSLAHLAHRLAVGVDLLDAMLQPSASELVAAGADVDEALELVDRRAREIRQRLDDEDLR